MAFLIAIITNFWSWLAVVLLLLVIGYVIAGIIDAIRPHRTITIRTKEGNQVTVDCATEDDIFAIAAALVPDDDEIEQE